MIFGEIESFVSLVERVIKPFKKYDKTPQELLSTRLVSVFEAHGVHRNQIPNESLPSIPITLGLLLLSAEPRSSRCSTPTVTYFVRPWSTYADSAKTPLVGFA